jgi:dinuclear metal center YbgI/SA1388 family protein
MRVSELVAYLNKLAPTCYQETYDNSGLLVGNPETEIKGVLVALDCIESVVDEAIATQSNVIVTHHPIIFSGLKRLTGATYIERTVIKAIQHNIALIAIHTNLDNMPHGVNQVICEKLGLQHTRILSPKENSIFQLSVYVPHTHTTVVQQALAEAGAGKIGNYEACSFTSSGEGRFLPTANAQPFVGEINQLQVEPEQKIEVLVPKHAINQVILAMKAAHPYEEVAYFLFPLSNNNPTIGSGMIGTLTVPIDSHKFLQHVKQTFGCGTVRYTKPVNQQVQHIAVCGGSGSFLLKQAIQQQADVFITADFKYHEFFDAESRIIIADIGHFESEQFTSHWIVEQLKKKFSTFAIRLTNVNTNPINYL